jgi:hypothetical protein
MTIYRVAYVAARLFYFGGKAMAKNTLDDAIAGLKDLAKEVKRYCERLVNNAKFDRTAVGTIVKVLDDHSGYVVAAFGKEYTIASNALFQVNDAVAVIAPQNDFKRLYIKPYEIDRNLLKQDKVEENLKDYVNKVDKLQEQVDGKVEQYFYNYDPTLENWPAMSWKDGTAKKAHNGDLFYNTDSKKGWQWTYNDETKTGSWVEVTDKETLDTLEAASKAQDTGDGKRQVFTADASKGEHPEPPYDTGDLWFNGEDILVCTVARTASDKYNASDWVKKDSYASKDEVKDYVDDVTKDMQDQIDSKAEQYFYAYDPTLDNEPAKSWTTDEDKAKHVDDLFFNTKTGKAYRFTEGDDDYKWELVQDEDITNALEAASKAQDTADGKRRVFTADASKDEHPDPPYDEGDLWYTGAEVLVCGKPKAKGETYDAGDWGKKDNYTNKDEVIDAVDKKLTQEDIFNRLTNNGASQGMFIEDGNVYFNATYIKSGEINSDLIKTGKISSKDGSVYFDLDNSVIHTTDGKFITTLDKNSILIKSGDNVLAQLHGYDESYGEENVVQIADALLIMNTYSHDTTENTTTHTDTMMLEGSQLSFRGGESGAAPTTYINKNRVTTPALAFNNITGTLTAQKDGSNGRLVSDFATIQSRGNIQLYKTGSSVPSFYVYDGTTNWGGQTLGWDGSKEVATLDANTQAVPFVYGIELVKNAQGYVTDVKLKQHGLRFIGGILV